MRITIILLLLAVLAYVYLAYRYGECIDKKAKIQRMIMNRTTSGSIPVSDVVTTNKPCRFFTFK